MDLQRKARKFQCWFDRQRQLVLTAFEQFPGHAQRMIDWGTALEVLKDWEGAAAAEEAMEDGPFQLQKLHRLGLTESVPEVALRTLSHAKDPYSRRAKSVVLNAVAWAGWSLLIHHDTRLMLLDQRTAQAVIDSENSPITAAELQYVPHHWLMVEFGEPVVIRSPQHTLSAYALGIVQYDSPRYGRCALLNWYLTNKLDLSCYSQIFAGETLPHPPVGARLGCWFGAGVRRASLDTVVARTLGFDIASPECESLVEAALCAARNVWDFLTSRSIRYVRLSRSIKKRGRDKVPHLQGARSMASREVFLLYLQRTVRVPEEKTSGSPKLWAYRVEVPGKFHTWCYCARCGDTHRRDLLGKPCRRCGLPVGPRANLRVEKYWHSPYLLGPEDAPVKEAVRVVRRQQPVHR